MNDLKMVIEPSFLPRLNLFRNVSPESIEVYLERSNVIELKAEEILIELEKEDKHIYCLPSGRLQIHLLKCFPNILQVFGKIWHTCI